MSIGAYADFFDFDDVVYVVRAEDSRGLVSGIVALPFLCAFFQIGKFFYSVGGKIGGDKSGYQDVVVVDFNGIIVFHIVEPHSGSDAFFLECIDNECAGIDAVVGLHIGRGEIEAVNFTFANSSGANDFAVFLQ